MNFQMSGLKPNSVMWEHFLKPVDENGVEDFRKTKCHHCTLRKLVHFKKGAHANDESLTKVVDFW